MGLIYVHVTYLPVTYLTVGIQYTVYQRLWITVKPRVKRQKYPHTAATGNIVLLYHKLYMQQESVKSVAVLLPYRNSNKQRYRLASVFLNLPF